MLGVRVDGSRSKKSQWLVWCSVLDYVHTLLLEQSARPQPLLLCPRPFHPEGGAGDEICTMREHVYDGAGAGVDEMLNTIALKGVPRADQQLP